VWHQQYFFFVEKSQIKQPELQFFIFFNNSNGNKSDEKLGLKFEQRSNSNHALITT